MLYEHFRQVSVGHNVVCFCRSLQCMTKRNSSYNFYEYILRILLAVSIERHLLIRQVELRRKVENATPFQKPALDRDPSKKTKAYMLLICKPLTQSITVFNTRI